MQTVPMGGLRLGLCCQFIAQPIKFRVTTATALQRLPRRERLLRVAGLCADNAAALLAALKYCAGNGIGSFRILSPILPVKTHPQVGYRIEDLPGADDILTAFRRCGEFGFSATGGQGNLRNPDLRKWRTHQELNLKPSDP